MSRIGIIAGGGLLPHKLVAACMKDAKDFFVLAIKGQTDKSLVKNAPHKWVKLGATEEAIKLLKSEKVTDIVMAGAIKRPGLFDIKLDLRTMQLIAEVGTSALGDDKLLKAISNEFEREGFKIMAAHDIEPSIITPKGCLTKREPSADNKADIEYGIKAAKSIGELDIGQAVLVQQGVVIAVEAVEGTNEAIKRYKENRYNNSYGGVLVKAAKPNQDTRIDLPTIGLKTVKLAFNAGLEGIAIEAGASIIIEREQVIELADKLGMFIVGFEYGEQHK